MAKPKAYVKDMYWFPKRNLNMEKVDEHYLLRLQTEGDWLEEPREAELAAYAIKKIKGTSYIGLPRGRPDLVRQCLKDRKRFKKTKDRQTDEPAKIKLRMVGTYRKYQKKAIREMTKHETGVLSAPPRMGKTVMAIGLTVEKQRKTLILAHQTDLIEQFLNQTINNDELFNGKELKKPVAGICRTAKDFHKYPICLATYQTFLSKKGRKLLHKIKDLFGMVFVDENHRVPAIRYTEILSEFSAKHMHGCTATPDRKDNLYLIADRILGPVRHQIGREDVMSPMVHGHESGFKMPPRLPKTWNGMMSMLYRNKRRNDSIVATVVQDVKDGHHVLLPVNRNSWAKELESRINAALGRKACFLFNGSIPKNKRQEARDKMRFDDDVKVTIATRSMLLGMDCPDWSAIYTIAPISNSPAYTQEIHRVCTPMPGKKRPIIRYFADSPLGLSYGCMVTCSKVLANPANGFHLTDSYKRLIAKANGRKTANLDPNDSDTVYRPKHGQPETLHIDRF